MTWMLLIEGDESAVRVLVGPDGSREWTSCSICERVVHEAREEHINEHHPLLCTACEAWVTYPSELDASGRCLKDQP